MFKKYLGWFALCCNLQDKQNCSQVILTKSLQFHSDNWIVAIIVIHYCSNKELSSKDSDVL